VVEEEGELIGTGGLVGETAVISRIVRVSVRADQRRRGLGRVISEQLIAEARRRGCREILVETTATWTAAIRLYQQCGFSPYAWQDGDIHMRKEIGDWRLEIGTRQSPISNLQSPSPLREGFVRTTPLALARLAGGL
jgi:hypothetical protein